MKNRYNLFKNIRKIFIYIFNPYTYFDYAFGTVRMDNYTKIYYYKQVEKTIDGEQIKWIQI